MLLETLSKHSKVSDASLNWLALTASQRYKTYEIPKRNGGVRQINHPSRMLKVVQRWIVRFLARRLEVHPSATAYSRGSSIRKNAEYHKNSNFTLRVDFKDFFPSFEASGIAAYLAAVSRERELDLSQQDVEFIARICSRHGRLTIGAPSSPILTNLLMYQFDHAMSTYCSNSKQIYTRYADDIFISTNIPGTLSDALEYLSESAIAFPFANLKINHEKTAFLSKKYHRSITGM